MPGAAGAIRARKHGFYCVFGFGSGFAEPPRSVVTRPCASIEPSRTMWAKSSRGGNFEASNAFLDAWTNLLVLMISLIRSSLAEKRPKYERDSAATWMCVSFEIVVPSKTGGRPGKLHEPNRIGGR